MCLQLRGNIKRKGNTTYNLQKCSKLMLFNNAQRLMTELCAKRFKAALWKNLAGEAQGNVQLTK